MIEHAPNFTATFEQLVNMLSPDLSKTSAVRRSYWPAEAESLIPSARRNQGQEKLDYDWAATRNSELIGSVFYWVSDR